MAGALWRPSELCSTVTQSAGQAANSAAEFERTSEQTSERANRPRAAESRQEGRQVDPALERVAAPAPAQLPAASIERRPFSRPAGCLAACYRRAREEWLRRRRRRLTRSLDPAPLRPSIRLPGLANEPASASQPGSTNCNLGADRRAAAVLATGRPMIEPFGGQRRTCKSRASRWSNDERNLCPALACKRASQPASGADTMA